MSGDNESVRIDGGLVWNGQDLQACSPLIEQGKITAFISPEKAGYTPADRVVDVTGQWILPGGIDIHVHISDGTETFWRGSCCAAAGGITTVLDMAPFHACVTPQQYKQKIAAADQEMLVDFGLIAGIVVSTEDLPHLEELKTLGTPFFKVFMPADPPVSSTTLWEAVKEASHSGLRLALHAEESACIEKVSNWRDPLAFAHSRPVVAESNAVGQVLEMARAAGAPIHICHVSASRTCELIAWGKAQGIDVTGETAVHYLLLNEEDYKKYGAKAKITPPLRSRHNNHDLWKALADGTIDAVACDHYTEAQTGKPTDMEHAASGIPGLEVSLPLLFSEGVIKKRISLARYISLTASSPAALAGMGAKKGRLAVGRDADFYCIDPLAEWQMSGQGEFSRIPTTPFSGWDIRGKITQTWLRGRQIWDGKNILQPASWGRWISSGS